MKNDVKVWTKTMKVKTSAFIREQNISARGQIWPTSRHLTTTVIYCIQLVNSIKHKAEVLKKQEQLPQTHKLGQTKMYISK